MVHARGRRGSGRRRLRELTRSVLDTMEILEEVREKQAGVGGMSKALLQVVKLGLHTCLQEPEERGGSGNITGGGGAHGSSGGIGSGSGNVGGSTGGSSGIFTSSGVGVVSGAPTPSPSSGSIGTPSGVPNTGYSASSASTPGGVGMAGGGGGAGVGAGEEVLPLGVASVLWELECCAAQARITLMNLNEGRPNHFGVFRAGVCVEEIRMLEEKVLELKQQAVNPREEKNASLEMTVAAGIRNCIARLWWCRRAGENVESMTWESFAEAFQADFGEQLPKALHVLRKHIATRGDVARPQRQSPRVTTAAVSGARRDKSASLPALSNSALSSSMSSASLRAVTDNERPASFSLAGASRSHVQRGHTVVSPDIWAEGPTDLPSPPSATASAKSNTDVDADIATGGFSGTWAAAAAAIEATTAASLASLTAAKTTAKGESASSVEVTRGPETRDRSSSASAEERSAAWATRGAEAIVKGFGGAAATEDSPFPGLDHEGEAGDEERQEGGGVAARIGAGALERGLSRLLSSVRRVREGPEVRRAGDSSSSANGGSKTGSDNHTTRADVVDDDDYDDDHCPEWRVPASRYEEVTWAHGGLYEAFQALADPRRVVFSMGVVDDGPHHEGGDGAEGGADATPVVVQDLLGLSVQQVCCGGQHAAVLTDCGEIFTWGRGGFGRLGHGNTDPICSPKRIEALQGIPCVQVACGFAYTAAVTASGELYTWGAGENGRLGLGDVEDRHTPSRVEGLHSKVREVYAGSVHSCVLTREGTVYAFGKHEYTGHGDKEDVLEPRLIPAFSGGSEALVRQISVGPGGYHTMALTWKGHVYAWGHNRVAQLGIGNSFTVPRNVEGAYFLPNPQLVESLLGMNIVKVVAGWGHSAALTMDGHLYVCGRNYQGQLGLGSPQRFPQNERGHPFQADFCLIERLQHLRIRQIACGGEHSVAVAENGEVWSFGAGQKGQLGHDSTTKEDFPRLVQALKKTRREILHVACGNNCTLILAGGVAFPSLFERAASVIRGNAQLWADVGKPDQNL